MTVYGKTGHNAACVNVEKRSIDFLKMYCFKRMEGTVRSIIAGTTISCRVVPGFPIDGHINVCTVSIVCAVHNH